MITLHTVIDLGIPFYAGTARSWRVSASQTSRYELAVKNTSMRVVRVSSCRGAAHFTPFAAPPTVVEVDDGLGSNLACVCLHETQHAAGSICVGWL